MEGAKKVGIVSVLSLGISVMNPQQALASNYFDFLANVGSVNVE